VAAVFDANLGSFNSPSPATGSTVALTMAAAAAVGSKLYVYVTDFDTAQTPSTMAGGGLTWTREFLVSNGSFRLALFTADAPAGLAISTVLTCTYTGVCADRTIWAYSATGVVTGTTNDGKNSSTTGSGATWTSGAMVAALTGDFIAGGGSQDGSGTATAAPSSVSWTEVHDFASAGSTESYHSVYQIPAGSGSFTAGGTFTPSGTVSVGGGVAYAATGGVIDPIFDNFGSSQFIEQAMGQPGMPGYPLIDPLPPEVPVGTTIVLGQAIETDVPQPFSASKTRALGQAIETDVAQPLARTKSRTLGQALETDLAQPLARTKSRVLGIASETDLAQTFARTKTRVLGVASETDLAQSLARLKKRTLGVATEVDLPQTFARSKTRILGVATESDLARPIVRVGVAAVRRLRTLMGMGQ
jgi:hypothetical protein